MAAVSFLQVSKTFPDGTRALEDLDLAVTDGELMVLVGPSGCGKTTALRLLAGLEAPTAGEILIGGQVVNGWSAQRRNVALVFQNYALYPHMTVRANLAFPLRMKKFPRPDIQRRVEEAARLLGLTGLLERKPAQLSGGQRQRVAMGRAIVRDPSVFLMDEPLSNLDAKLRVQIRTEIAALQRRFNATTLYVTHDQVEAMTLGDRVAVMEAGRLQQVDPPRRLYDRPANTFVAAFVGSPGMNLFETRLRAGADDLFMALGDAWIRVPPDIAADRGALATHCGKPLLAGVRPEAFCVAGAGQAAIEGRVEAVEILGHEALVYFRPPWPGSKPLVARLAGQPDVTRHEQLPLGIDASRLYFFSAKGEAIY
jgi:multiple sugar transport system ATP-binding protein